MKKLFLLFSIVFIISCCDNDYLNHFQVKNRSVRNISFTNIPIHQIFLDSVETSHFGIFSVDGDSILFIDYVLCQVFSFDTCGNHYSRYLGKGRGPGEINAGYIETYCQLSNGNHLFISEPWDVHIFDRNWDRVNEFRIDWQADIRNVYEIRNPSPKESRFYSFEYEKFTPRSNSKNQVLLPVYSEHPNFNAWSSFDYYKNGRILALLDIENHKIVDLYGRRSPEYLKYKYAGHHSFFTFDIDKNDNLFISHEIDSLIYVYDASHNPSYSFGFAGKDMNTDYQELSILDRSEIKRLYREDRPLRGFYNEIKYFNHNNSLFRSYKNNGCMDHDGLQIYLDNMLVGDVDVPKDFSVIGFISPYYLGAVVNDIEETRNIYKFLLPSIEKSKP